MVPSIIDEEGGNHWNGRCDVVSPFPSLGPSLPDSTLQPGLATPPGALQVARRGFSQPRLPRPRGCVERGDVRHCRRGFLPGERTNAHGARSCASRCSLRRAHRRAHVRANTGENTRSRSASEGEAALGEIRGTQACGGDDDDEEEKQRQSCESLSPHLCAPRFIAATRRISARASASPT